MLDTCGREPWRGRLGASPHLLACIFFAVLQYNCSLRLYVLYTKFIASLHVLYKLYHPQIVCQVQPGFNYYVVFYKVVN